MVRPRRTPVKSSFQSARVPATEENLKWLEGKKSRLHRADEPVAEDPMHGVIHRQPGGVDMVSKLPYENWVHVRRSQGTRLGRVGGMDMADRKTGKPLPPGWELEPL